MKPHPRIRKTIKWGATLCTAILTAGIVVSFFRNFGVEWALQNRVDCKICDGQLKWFEGFGPSEYGRHVWWVWRKPFFFVGDASILPRWYHFGSGITITVPLWLPLVALFSTTLWLWRLDTLARRRAKLNLCPKCNYDRTGILKDAKCPECGAVSAGV